MKIIVGLGNPEQKYFKTYHNIGFMCVDSIAEDLGLNFSFKNALNSEIAEIIINKSELCKIYNLKKIVEGKEKFVFVKPHTYMNLSGDAVKAAMKKFGAKIEDVIVCVDDVDLPAGKFRIREHGSAGTHNGLRNITERVNSENFMRVRIGMDSDERGELLDYVLSNISPNNKVLIDNAIKDAKIALFDKILWRYGNFKRFKDI